MDSDGACSDSGQSNHSNDIGAVTPQVAAARAAYYAKGDKIREFLASQKIQAWIELDEMRKKIWRSEEANKHFEKQRENADGSTQNITIQVGFLNMMLGIAREIQVSTGVFTSVRPKNPRSVLAKPVRCLDTSMAPGGFAQYFLSQNPRATVDGLSLPVESGGHSMLLQDANKTLGVRPRPQDKDVNIAWTDVTLHPLFLPQGKEYPEEFPDKPAFDGNQPLHPHLQSPPNKPSDRVYDIIISDGAYLRIHAHAQLRHWEAGRLLVSQLILGLSFIKPGGSVLILLHHLENWNTFATVYNFSRIANIRLYKPEWAHAIRSSFYLIATKVQPELDVCKAWVEELKRAWYAMTFGGEEGLGGLVEAGEGLNVDKMLDEWGEEFVVLGENVWKRQRDALKRKGWVG
ncbi:hypothetical protein EV426DRAFT_206655 [Tirmania nivea]|nr:hypothetical protein EV426DRAFT_206655 [Tirmania nivea]